MKVLTCECGNTDVFTMKTGVHVGIYCNKCGKLLKLATKEEMNALVSGKRFSLDKIDKSPIMKEGGIV